MRILIITDSYPPEVRSSSHLMKEMADGLKERGHEVCVVTSYPQHHIGGEMPKGMVLVEDGITVIRVKIVSHHNVNFVQKGISQVSLPYLFFGAVRKNIKGRLDIVFVHSPPLTLAIAANLVKNHYGAKFCLNVQDFFPQNAIDLGILKNPLLVKFFQNMERNAYKNCDFIVTPSEGHKKYLIENRGVPEVKINVVPHWIDMAEFESAKKTGRFRKLYNLENKFIFLFGGVFGPSQGLDIFIRIAVKLKDYKDIIFLFVGEGSEKEKLIELTKSLGLENVRFEPLVSKKDYPELVKNADVGILALTSANTTPAVPAKLMGYMAAGIPVLAFLHKESDGIKIIETANCGLASVSNNEEKAFELTKKIYSEKDKLKSYGENGFNYAMANFSKDVCVNKMESLFKL